MIEQKWFAEINTAAAEAISSGDSVMLKRADRQVRAALIRGLLRAAQGSRKLDRENAMDFMLSMGRFAHLSQAQLFQDLWVLWETNEKQTGYFVEFGAVDGKTLSNTWLLEKKFGWNGIVSEPNPAFALALNSNRTCYATTKCVHWRSGDTVPFRVVDRPELSRLGSIDPQDNQEAGGFRDNFKEVLVTTISLNDLLTEAEAPSRIDYLSIDTEGSEYEILKELDFDKWRIDLISVEHNKTPKRALIHGLLTRAGYRRKWEFLTQYDDWYVRADHKASDWQPK